MDRNGLSMECTRPFSIYMLNVRCVTYNGCNLDIA